MGEDVTRRPDRSGDRVLTAFRLDKYFEKLQVSTPLLWLHTLAREIVPRFRAEIYTKKASRESQLVVGVGAFRAIATSKRGRNQPPRCEPNLMVSRPFV